MENEKIRYRVSGKSIFVRISAVLMIVSMVFRVMGYWGFWKNQTPAFCYMQILLPILCGILYIVIILYLGERAFWLTVIPVILGAVFFIVKSTDFDGIFKTVLCMAVSVLTVIVYTATVFGKIRSKWLLAPLFGLPLLYQLIIRDGATILAREGAMSLNEFIPELSVLCILLALLMTVFAMKKRVPEVTETVEGETVVEEFEAADLLEKPKEQPVAEIENKEAPAVEENIHE